MTRRAGWTTVNALLASFLLTGAQGAGRDSWTFVSSPDFFNFDIAYPQPKWEDAITYFLDAVKGENPDFFLVAGDLVNGHWWDSPEQVEHMASLYYGGWVRRMHDHGLKFYVCLGDHEVGDNPWPPEKIALVPNFKEAFANHMTMPKNGPEGFDGMAYSFVHHNTLFVTVDTFEVRDGKMRHTVSGQQLEWFEKTLAEHHDADHVVVMGHCPILPGVRSRSSSRLMLEEGQASEFWQLMAQHGVDMYLCGEHHDITVKEADGVWQIVHGASWGRVPDVNYLVVKVTPKKMSLEIKRIPLELDGGAIWNINKERGPREYVRIPEEAKTRGFETVGTLVIDKSTGQKQFEQKLGCFAED